MRNANAFAMLSEALDEAQRNRSALIEHIQRVEASADAHDELTDLLASGADIRQFLEKMSDRIGGAVFLYDDEFRIHDEFVTSSYKSVLADELRAGRIDLALLINANAQSRQTGRSVMILERGNEQCRTIALHGGNGRRDCLVICHLGELEAIRDPQSRTQRGGSVDRKALEREAGNGEADRLLDATAPSGPGDPARPFDHLGGARASRSARRPDRAARAYRDFRD